jgi:hypothetical protein
MPDAVSLEAPDTGQGTVRFVFNPALFPPGRYRVSILFDRVEGVVTYLRVYEVRSRDGWLARFWEFWSA